MRIFGKWVAWIVLLNCIRLRIAQLLRDKSVQCQSEAILVSLEFRGPFSGVVYAENFFQTQECHWTGNGAGSLVVAIPLNANVDRQPYCGVQFREETGAFTVSIVLSPVRNLLVEGMEKLTLRCIYSMEDVTLTLPAGANGAGIYINPQSAGSVVTGSGGSPFLQMAIKDGHGIEGGIIQSASVGQRITLDVIMQDTTIYDFWVHDCYAHDGTNSPEASVAILDNNGCVVRLARAVDPPVFETPPNPAGAKHVYVYMYGFQFTTSQLVYFECQVRPCLQTCNRQQCGANLNAAQNRLGINGRAKRQQLGDSYGTIALDHHALKRIPREVAPDNYNLTAVIRIEPQNLDAFTPVARDDPDFGTEIDPSRICIHTSVAIVILAAFIIVCVLSLCIAICLCHRARRDSIRDTKIKRVFVPLGSRYRTTSDTPVNTSTYLSQASSVTHRSFRGSTGDEPRMVLTRQQPPPALTRPLQVSTGYRTSYNDDGRMSDNF